MFVEFFYHLRGRKIPVSPTAFLRLQRALDEGLIRNLNDFYSIARALMVKSERYFDEYDKVFAAYFQGKEIDDSIEEALSGELQSLLDQWLKDPLSFPFLDEKEREKLRSMTPEELMKYFRDRLQEQTERHDGGNRWIGTGGTSPVGHSGHHPGGMRVGGSPGSRSAIKVAMDRRYVDYSDGGMLTPERIGDGLAKLKVLRPSGPKDQLDIDATIKETVKQGGEIDLVFKASLRDKLKVILMLDNGGWSMTPYVEVCRSLFTYARNQFKELKTFYFHNCIYDTVWEDAMRMRKPQSIEAMLRWDDDWRVIIVGDASMSPWELLDSRGSIDWSSRQSESGKAWLEKLRDHFKYSVWLNPIPAKEWDITYGAQTVDVVGKIFPMYEMTVKGLEEAVDGLID